jgi:hypothetical protein
MKGKKVVALLLSLCFVMALLPVGAQAATIVAEGTCGVTMTWTLYDDGTLSISGTRSIPSYLSESSVPWYDYRTSIKSVVLENGVIGIGQNAFYNCTNLTSVTLPETLTNIGVSAFSNCDSLTSITLPQSMKVISNTAFSYCDNLKTINIPGNVTQISSYAFYECPKLEKIIIPASVEFVQESAFNSCKGLKEVIIHSFKASFGSYAFSGCSSLHTITFTDDPPELSSTTFNNVSATVYYPAGNANWTADVMQNYGGNLVWVAQEMEEVGPADGYCGKDLKWELDENGILSIYGSGDMYDDFYETQGYWYSQRDAIKSVNIGQEVTSIASCAFEGCVSLESIKIPASVKFVSFHVFRECDKLTIYLDPGCQTEKWGGLWNSDERPIVAK